MKPAMLRSVPVVAAEWPVLLLGGLLLVGAAGCSGHARPLPPTPAGSAAADPAPAGSVSAPPADASAEPAATLPDFELDTASGQRVRLGELLAGKQALLISFWATWCEPCKLELPHLDRLQKQYAAQGLTVLAVATDEPSAVPEIRSFLRRRRFDLVVPLDSDRRLTDHLNPKLIMPFWLLFDRSGRVVRTHQGYLPGDEDLLEREIRALLATDGTSGGGNG